jgi:hypothetical protein
VITDLGRPAVKGRWRAWLLLLMLLVLPGCSGMQLVYDRLGTLIPWYFRDFVDLDTGQRQTLERSVETLLVWHRESQVGRYAAFFNELERDAATPLGAARIESARRELDQFWQDIVEQLTPEAAGLLASLSDAQVDAMFARIAAKDAREEREASRRTAAQRVERRERALRRQLERWVGRLDAAQRARVADCARQMSTDPSDWFDSRRRWQAALREALAARADGPAFEERFGQLLGAGDQLWTEAYRRDFHADRGRVQRLIVDIDVSLTPEQRTRLRQRLARFALDFEAIAGGA